MPFGRLKKFIWFGAIFAASILALLGWAMFWPEDACAQPACAKPRFSLTIELDAFRQVAPIDFDVPVGKGSVSLQSIMSEGGIDIHLQPDQMDLPYMAASGPLDRADLYQFARARRSLPLPPDVDARIYALLATALISDTGEPLFGIMFDDVDREGFAVAPDMTRSKFGDREPAAIPLLQLRTFAHELLHALNRRHLDAALMDDGRLSLEAPTHCIAGQERGQWYLREFPLLALSPDTIRFFQTGSPRDILPGRENASFQKHGSPTECEDARANLAGARAETRWQLAGRRLQQLFSMQAAIAAEELPGKIPHDESTVSGSHDSDSHDAGLHDAAGHGAGGNDETAAETNARESSPAPPPADLRIQAIPAAYPLGYPIAVRILARNEGDKALPIKGRLTPGYGMVHIEYRPVSDSSVPDPSLPDANGPDANGKSRDDEQADWRGVEPLAWFEPAGDEQAMLAPGEVTEQTVPVFFGSDGWTFRTPGSYQLRAKMHAAKGVPDVTSKAIDISIEAPRTSADEAALQPLLNEQGELDDNAGRLLTFGGRIGAHDDIAPLEATVQRYRHTALGSALRLTLISQRLRPAIDPLTGLRPLPDFGDARDMLKDTCTDSGIAALKHQMLLRHTEAIPDGMSQRTETGAAAWDGITTPHGETIATYSDPDLERWGPAVQFCFNDAQLQGATRRQAQRFARRLKRSAAQRIVLVGHGDFSGTCRYNDDLGLRRAATLRQILINQGIAGRRIRIASLGERRPLDFSSTHDAHTMNRRVDILVQRGTPPTEPQFSSAIASRCAARPPLPE